MEITIWRNREGKAIKAGGLISNDPSVIANYLRNHNRDNITIDGKFKNKEGQTNDAKRDIHQRE